MIRHTSCPSCHGQNLNDFFQIKNAPIFSLVTVTSKDEALAVPKQDIQLSFCQECGFIFNRSYDTGINYFTMGYEDQQGFSATFMAYLKRISETLIDEYQLQGKALMEIGCGKGDFINLLSDLAQGDGIGVDPAYVEGRQNNPRLTFYKEFYDHKHGLLKPDFICCRHTMEHVFDTYGFLRLLRESIPDGQRPVLFFEVPQINRILDIQAFWDIYYEHCSYFNATSFAALFRRCGFTICDVRLDYGDQYLLLEAVPAGQEPEQEQFFDLEEPVTRTAERVARFQVEISRQLGEWRQRLEAEKQSGNKVVIWGGGSKSVGFLTNFADLSLIDYVVDINPNMEGNFIPGIGSQYVQPEFLKQYQPDTVIIMNGMYRDEITKTMTDMGVTPQIFTL